MPPLLCSTVPANVNKIIRLAHDKRGRLDVSKRKCACNVPSSPLRLRKASTVIHIISHCLVQLRLISLESAAFLISKFEVPKAARIQTHYTERRTKIPWKIHAGNVFRGGDKQWSAAFSHPLCGLRTASPIAKGLPSIVRGCWHVHFIFCDFDRYFLHVRAWEFNWHCCMCMSLCAWLYNRWIF